MYSGRVPEGHSAKQLAHPCATLWRGNANSSKVHHFQRRRTQMGKTIRICAALALSALASTAAFAQGGGAPPGGQGAGRGPAAPPQPMSFFITSTSKGDGANYGGLAGADAYCAQLAAAAGPGGWTWPPEPRQQREDSMPRT